MGGIPVRGSLVTSIRGLDDGSPSPHRPRSGGWTPVPSAVTTGSSCLPRPVARVSAPPPSHPHAVTVWGAVAGRMGA
jgi:hypothetical protein